MEKNLLKEVGIMFSLAGALTGSDCGTFYPGMRYDDKGLGLKISEDLNGNDKPRYVVYNISDSKYKSEDKNRK